MIERLRWTVASAAEHTELGRGAPPAGFLSERELGLYARFRFDERRRKWLMGRWAAKRLLRELLGERGLDVAPDRITIDNEPSGAPFAELAGEGRLPWSLSLSHREDLALAGARGADEPPIGVDLEIIAPREPALVRTFFSDEEAEVVAAAPAGRPRELAVARIWSAKEAVLKAMGTGLRVDTRRVIVCETAAPERRGWRALAVTVRSDGVAPPATFAAAWRDEGRYVLTAAALR